MKELQERNITYEVSIIFGIPSQTVETFKKTIEFLEENGCKKFCAFPLRLPQNSKMAEQRDKLKIKEIQGKHFSLSFVSECDSFNQSQWETMYILTAIREDKPPFCGDPIEAIKPVIDKITRSYIFGGLHGRFWKR
jgi:MoaA/NifB/PqqE/SkfB family radical SAM enzyme